MLARTTFLACSIPLCLACGEPAPAPIDSGTDAPVEPIDAGQDAGPPPSALCDELGLARTAFVSTGTGDGWGEIAGDFTATLRDGSTFTLSDRWSGCESYVFFVHFPGATDDVIRSNSRFLFQEGPRNVRYFYLSDDPDPAARAALMDELAANLEVAFEFSLLEPDEATFWRERIHFVTDRAREVEGSVGSMLTSYLAWASTPESRVDLGDRGIAGAPLPIVFGIDRAQAWDPGDNLSPSVGAAPMIGMAAFLGHFYEYRAALESRLAAETATTVVTLLDERTTGRVFTREVTLPDATAMAEFDTLEVDVAITCDEGNPFACSEWDRIADVQLCVDGAPCTDRREIARWITPYWRRGRQHYLIDATPFLALMRDGGAKTFFVELGPDWERATEWVAQVSLRLRTRGGEPRATGGGLAFRGGTFDATYNVREPFLFTPPASATRVELVTILSGHGQTSGDNCAEWCDHQHTFSVNGTALPAITHEGEPIGSARGCAARASEGVIPGQWGNWAQERAYWCPGLPVAARRTDITSQVTLGSENQLTYAGSFLGGDPRGGDIALSAYVVWYE